MEKKPTILHKVIATGLLSSAFHLLAYPLDCIKVRKMARSRVHDVARFEANQVISLTLYLGFFKGYLSMIMGNMCFLTLGQQNFLLGVVAEGLFKTFVDISKISTQMGNEAMKMDITKKVFPVAAAFSMLRDLTSRYSYMWIVSSLIEHNKEWIKQDHMRKYHIFFAGAIIGTVVSHPFDLLFTKVASQRSLKYAGLIGTLRTVIKEEGGAKIMSGLEYRLFYNLVGAIIMGNSYEQLLRLTLEAF